MKNMIEIINVSMRYNLGIEKEFSLKQGFVDLFKRNRKEKINNEFWALRDINLEIEMGEVIGLIGANGAGKSTLLKIIAGVMKPTIGNVKIGGSICPLISLGAGFDAELTGRENIFFNGAVMGYSKNFLKSKYQEIVDFSELHDFMEVPVKNFSSGMVARLAFSISTIVEPEILIVDEVLSVGDMAFQAKSENKMMSIISGGTTVFFVSHSLEQVKKICNRVIWLDNGEIIKAGDEKICDEYKQKYLGG